MGMEWEPSGRGRRPCLKRLQSLGLTMSAAGRPRLHTGAGSAKCGLTHYTRDASRKADLHAAAGSGLHTSLGASDGGSEPLLPPPRLAAAGGEA